MSKNTKKLVPKLRFPEFRDAGQWAIKHLGEVSKISTGSSNREDSTTGSGAYTFFDRSQDIRTSNIYLFDGEVVIVAGEGQEFVPKYFVGKFDLHQRTYAIMDFQSCSGLYLFYYINQFRGYFLAQAVGSTVKSLRLPMFQEMPIGFPDRKEQQKIADCLSSIDDLITAQSQKVEALKTHKKGLMQQLFPREGETVPRLRFPEFRDAGAWDESAFEKFVIKSFYGTSSSTLPTGRYPVLRMGNMVDGDLDFTSLVYIDMDPDSFESFRLEEGDILLNRTNSPALVGKVSIFRLKSECITASYIVTYRLNKKLINPLFCNFMLNTPLHQSKIKMLAKPSVSQANINPTTFKKELIVKTPKTPEQQKIADCLSSIDDLISAQSQKLEILKTHKKGLMQQLFPSSNE